jgi:hypothetical protein
LGRNAADGDVYGEPGGFLGVVGGEEEVIQAANLRIVPGVDPVRVGHHPRPAGLPGVLAGLARGILRSKTGRLTEALTGRFTDHHAFLLDRMLHRIDGITADIATVQERIDAQIAPFAQAIARLDEIPSVGVTAAQLILAEVGTDMARFPTPAHLASWARFAPGVSESAGRKKGNAGTGHGNRYLARVLGEAAVGAARTDTFLGERYRRIARRRGKNRAIVAVGRSSSSSCGHCSPTRTPSSSTSARTTTTPAPTPSARSANTSGSCSRWATQSPSAPQPDRGHRDFRISGPLRAGCWAVPLGRSP